MSAQTPENPLGSIFAETSGEVSPEEQARRDEAIMANLRERRAAEAAAEATDKAQVALGIDQARATLEGSFSGTAAANRQAAEKSASYDDPEAHRRGFN